MATLSHTHTSDHSHQKTLLKTVLQTMHLAKTAALAIGNAEETMKFREAATERIYYDFVTEILPALRTHQLAGLLTNDEWEILCDVDTVASQLHQKSCIPSHLRQ